jgi:hypothetical protein
VNPGPYGRVSRSIRPRRLVTPGVDRLPPALTKTSLKTTLRLTTLLAILIVGVTVAGCGLEQRTTLTGISETQFSNGVEPYFNVGGVTYQVQESRALNPFSTEDVQYLTGVAGAQNIGATQTWYAVFLWAKNQDRQTLPVATTFRLVDSSGTVYDPTTLPAVNPYAWKPIALQQNSTEPNSNSTASEGPAGGGLILFKVNESVYSNRPLTLEIYAPGSTKPSKVSLDL